MDCIDTYSSQLLFFFRSLIALFFHFHSLKERFAMVDKCPIVFGFPLPDAHFQFLFQFGQFLRNRLSELLLSKQSSGISARFLTQQSARIRGARLKFYLLLMNRLSSRDHCQDGFALSGLLVQSLDNIFVLGKRFFCIILWERLRSIMYWTILSYHSIMIIRTIVIILSSTQIYILFCSE